MMRRLLLLLATTLSLAPLLASQAQALSISLVASPTVELGQPLEVEIWVAGLGNFSAPSLGFWQLDVVFGPELTFAAAASEGSLGDPLVPESIGFSTPGVGTVNVGEVSLLSTAALDALQPDTMRLATLTFDTLTPGLAVLSAENPILGDAQIPAGDLGTPLLFGATVVVNSAIPEPGAALVFAVGCTIVGVAARRRRSEQR